jgi:DNA-binding MarR family transcriptional regulator
MASPSLAQDVLEFSAIWHDVIRLQPRFKTLLPTNLARAKEHFRTMHSRLGAKHMPDHPFFYRAAIIFSRQDRPLIMGELSEELGVPLSTATRIVDWFVEGGYARREPDAKDRRIVRVTLTQTGKELFQEMDHFIHQQVERILAQFTPRERKNLIALSRKMVRVFEDASQIEPILKSPKALRRK